MKALLIGGYQDGMVMDVPMVTDSIEGLVPAKFRVTDMAMSTVNPPTRVRYERKVIELWDVKIPVYVLRGWPTERIEATLAKVLLSETAHDLAERA